ncbi:hypothetical protein AMTR_s00017p00125780 [Amborella trichopoda]|uniref:Uncharacterized protein n=1 Tax=Amborella trichopoda TaxID=13333 RepID=W1PN17_AMBTC|nr:hypothetical protein AMTR_s00017p00125780 [Amborella trichopoda]
MASKGGPGYANALPMDGKPPDLRYMMEDNGGGSLPGSGSKDACAAGYGEGAGGDGEDLKPQNVLVLNESREALRPGGSAEDLRSVDCLDDVLGLCMGSGDRETTMIDG